MQTSQRVRLESQIATLEIQECISGRPPASMNICELSLGPERKHSQTNSRKKHSSNLLVEYSGRFLKAVENKMFPHFLAVFQWALPVMTIAFNLNYAVAITEGAAFGGVKTIMFSQLLIPFLSSVLCLAFYRVRREGAAEKSIIVLSVITILFSFVNVSLHFVDDLALLMKATELAAWSVYNVMFSISIYKILVSRTKFVGFDREKLRREEEV